MDEQSLADQFVRGLQAVLDGAAARIGIPRTHDTPQQAQPSTSTPSPTRRLGQRGQRQASRSDKWSSGSHRTRVRNDPAAGATVAGRLVPDAAVHRRTGRSVEDHHAAHGVGRRVDLHVNRPDAGFWTGLDRAARPGGVQPWAGAPERHRGIATAVAAVGIGKIERRLVRPPITLRSAQRQAGQRESAVMGPAGPVSRMRAAVKDGAAGAGCGGRWLGQPVKCSQSKPGSRRGSSAARCRLPA